MNIKQKVNTVGAAFAFSPFGLPLVVHGAAGLLVGTMGLKLVNGVINDLKGAGDTLQQQMGNPDESEQNDEQEGF